MADTERMGAPPEIGVTTGIVYCTETTPRWLSYLLLPGVDTPRLLPDSMCGVPIPLGGTVISEYGGQLYAELIYPQYWSFTVCGNKLTLHLPGRDIVVE